MTRDQLEELAKRLAEGATVLDEPFHREAIAATMNDASTFIRSLLAQEPVAWIEHRKTGDNLRWIDPGEPRTPLVALPSAQAVAEASLKIIADLQSASSAPVPAVKQEPVAWRQRMGELWHWNDGARPVNEPGETVHDFGKEVQDLYAAPVLAVEQHIGDSRCNYLMTAGHICNKCGRIHDGKSVPAVDPDERQRILTPAFNLGEWKAEAMRLAQMLVNVNVKLRVVDATLQDVDEARAALAAHLDKIGEK